MTLPQQTVYIATLLIAVTRHAPAQEPFPDAGPVERDVTTRLKRQRIGTHTLENYALPDTFLRRVADRIIRIDYQDRFRMVYRDDTADTSPASGPTAGKVKPSPPEPTSPRHRGWLLPTGLAAALIASAGIAIVVHRKRRDHN